MASLAERLAALRNKPVNPTVIEANVNVVKDTPDDKETITEPVNSGIGSNVDNPGIENSSVQDDAGTIPAICTIVPSESLNLSDDDKARQESAEESIKIITERAFGFEVNCADIQNQGEALRNLMADYGLKDDFPIAKYEIMRAAFTREIVKVHDMGITDIVNRIKGLELVVEASNAMILACKETEKEKKRAETALQREERKAAEDKQYAEDKANGKVRRKGNVDKHGAIVESKKLSERDKFINKMVKQGFSKEKAEALWDE